MLKKTSTKIIIIGLLLFATITSINYYKRNTLITELVTKEELKEDESIVESVFYKAEAETNAFELLKEAAEIEYQEYDFGVFVESINGVKGDDKHFWALYVNSEQSLTGADQIMLKAGDKVEWRYEAIK